MIFILGVIVGVLLSLVAIISGKKFERFVNDPKISNIKNSLMVPQATIIKKENPIEEFLNEFES